MDTQDTLETEWFSLSLQSLLWEAGKGNSGDRAIQLLVTCGISQNRLVYGMVTKLILATQIYKLLWRMIHKSLKIGQNSHKTSVNSKLEISV